MSASITVRQRLFSAVSVALLMGLMFNPGSPAQAQVSDHRWELGFALGNANVDSSSEDFDLDFREEFRGGAYLSDHFQLELQVMRAQAPFDAQVLTGMANGVFNFLPARKIVPYALVGAGIAELDDIAFLSNLPGVSESSGAYQVAVGSRFFLGSDGDMALRIELSNLWIDTDLFDADRHTSITAGLSWTFGQR
ncbi:MAG: porin family protein [Deltaproteobacteria bacterium]|nr:porin family protein [Deltaproteobacteria bacterium]